jgi:hypothetical protein
MTTSGTFVAGYPIPTNTSSLAITGGPDGNIWFGEWDYAKIGQITPTGVVTEYPVGGARISGITTGPDGNIWFASRDGWVGRIEVAAADTTAPTITVPDGITVGATSPSGAVVTYSVSATDADDAVASLSCTPASGSTFPIGTTTVTCTATDTHGNSSTASFTVHVEGAAEQLADLLTAATGVGPGTSLGDKVSQAENYVTVNDAVDACSTLRAFINEVKAQSGVKVTPNQAATLITTAQRIEAVLGC